MKSHYFDKIRYIMHSKMALLRVPTVMHTILIKIYRELDNKNIRREIKDLPTDLYRTIIMQ